MSDPAVEAALTWAGKLALKHHTLDLPGLQAAWTSPVATVCRASLKEHKPEFLRQLVAAMTGRINELKQGAPNVEQDGLRLQG